MSFAIQRPSSIANSYSSSYTRSYLLDIESCDYSLKSVAAKISLIISPIIILITLLADLIVAIAKCICCKKNNQPSLLQTNSNPIDDANQKIREFAIQHPSLSIEMDSPIVNEMEFDTPLLTLEVESHSPTTSPRHRRIPLMNQLPSAIPLFAPILRSLNERLRERNAISNLVN